MILLQFVSFLLHGKLLIEVKVGSAQIDIICVAILPSINAFAQKATTADHQNEYREKILAVLVTIGGSSG